MVTWEEGTTPVGPEMTSLTPGKRHILLVEDHPTQRRALRFNLVNAGFRVTEAADGIQALNLAQEDTFDLVITDYHMTPLLGSQLVKRLREIERYWTTPVIMLTGFANELNSQFLRDQMLVLLLAKPYSVKHLLDAVSKCLAVSHSAV